MRDLPSLTSLAAFESAARHRSFKTAARELGVTPTAVSHQIRILEDAVGRRLFRRRPRPITLTEAGTKLFPVLEEGLDAFAEAVAAIRRDEEGRPLRVTTTNAFAHRWFVPRLPLWRAERPEVALEVLGDDAVLDLEADEADLAIRYARTPPSEGPSHEILRDRFYPVCTPSLLADRPVRHPGDLADHTLIHLGWPPDPNSPTWERWFAHARSQFHDLPEIDLSRGMSFREELHGIEAVIAGQGISVCSDVLVSAELRTGRLVKVFDLPLPGFGFYLVYRRGSPREPLILAFLEWLQSVA